MKAREIPGGRILEIAPGRIIGWLNRFADRNAGMTELTGGADGVMVLTSSGAKAVIAAPLTGSTRTAIPGEPVAELLAAAESVAATGIIAVRGGAHSIGIARGGAIERSSTDRHYLQGRTAAGGWSQQRFARRRGNQRSKGQQEAIATALRVLTGYTLDALVLAGDRASYTAVVQALPAELADLPRREFPEIAEPRRVVLDELARRAQSLVVTVTDPS